MLSVAGTHWHKKSGAIIASPGEKSRFKSLLIRRLVILTAIISLPLKAEDVSINFQHYEPETGIVRIDINEAPKIDGDISDPVWSRATRIDTFYQTEPIQGAKPSETTIAYMAYDENNLYFAFFCGDSQPDQILATVMQRDRQLFQDDNIRVYLDPYNSARDAMAFLVNSLGTQMDILIENNSNFYPEWDTIWDVEARRTSNGWTAEMAIPFRSISFDPGVDEWGFEIMRQIRHKNETVRWSQIDQFLTPFDVSRIGLITGIRDTRRGLGLDVQAFGKLKYERDWMQRPRDNDFTPEPSGNIFYKITPSLTGTLTLNTDFSDSPLDERQVNTGRFSLFFPETRDFFLQDRTIFEFGGNAMTPPNTDINGLPFFTRKIGIVNDEVVDLIAGGKLSGRIGNLNVGALSVRMDNTDNIDAETLSVARLSADILEESRIGAILTNGDPDGKGKNTLLGVDFQYQNSNLFNRGRFLADIFYQRSFSDGVHGPAGGIDDDMFGFFLGYPNDLLRWFISGKEVGNRFEPALGFINRRNIRDYNGDYVRRKRFEGGWVRWWEGGVIGNIVTDLDNDIESHKFTLVTALQNQIGDEFTVKAGNVREVINQPFLIAGELPVPVGDYHFNQFDVLLESSKSRKVIANLGLVCCRIYDGDYLGLNTSLEFRVSKYFRLTASHNLEKFELPAGNLTVHIGSLDGSINFTPDMQIDTQMQYDNISERFSFSARFRWFPKPQTEIFMAVGQTADLESSNFPGDFDPDKTQALIRLGHTFRF